MNGAHRKYFPRKLSLEVGTFICILCQRDGLSGGIIQSSLQILAIWLIKKIIPYCYKQRNS